MRREPPLTGVAHARQHLFERSYANGAHIFEEFALCHEDAPRSAEHAVVYASVEVVAPVPRRDAPEGAPAAPGCSDGSGPRTPRRQGRERDGPSLGPGGAGGLGGLGVGSHALYDGLQHRVGVATRRILVLLLHVHRKGTVDVLFLEGSGDA